MGNDPLDRTDPDGTYSCGASLDSTQCASFTSAQDQVKAQLTGSLKAIGGLKDRIESGGKLTSADQKLAAGISKVLGSGAGTNAKVLGSLVAAGNKMLGQLNGSMPAEIGKGVSGYARADAGQLTLNAGRFFGSSSGMASQILAHESHHHAVEPGRTDTKYNYRTPGRVERISAYGYPAMVRQAELRNNPERMLKIPDAATFALGFDRDDD